LERVAENKKIEKREKSKFSVLLNLEKSLISKLKQTRE